MSNPPMGTYRFFYALMVCLGQAVPDAPAIHLCQRVVSRWRPICEKPTQTWLTSCYASTIKKVIARKRRQAGIT